jgi:hypothetical protein
VNQDSSTPHPAVKKSKAGSLKKLIREVESEDDEEEISDVMASTANSDPSKPWLSDFRKYVDTLEATPPSGMSTIQWWGVRLILYLNPTVYALINKPI